MKRIIHQVLLLAFSSMALALAAAGRPNPELRKEVHAYVSKQVMPVLKEHRQQLDKQMTAADKKKVAQLRQELKKLESQHKQLLKDKPRQRPATKQEQKDRRKDGPRKQLTEEQKATLKADREARHRIFEEARTIAVKYQPQLERIHTSLASHKTTWEQDMKAIADKYTPEKEENVRHRRPMHFGRMMNFQHFMRPVHFILWDVKTMPAPDEAETESSLTVYPNPSSSTTTIAYTVDEASPVKITLLNDRGTIVRTLLNEQKQPGTHSLDVDVKSLANGIYFYKIENGSSTKTLRFVKR